MEQNVSVFTLLFQDPFWVGIAQRWDKDGYCVSRTVFGAQPSDPQLYQWVLTCWDRLTYTTALPEEIPTRDIRSPKRAQREARRATQASGMSTKAQRALSRERELQAQTRAEQRRQTRQEQQEERFQLRQQKKRERKRGH